MWTCASLYLTIVIYMYVTTMQGSVSLWGLGGSAESPCFFCKVGHNHNRTPEQHCAVNVILSSFVI